jgi:hypothetical protein
MATYAEVIEHVKSTCRIDLQPCWIAHVKEMNGVPTRKVWNRGGERKKPCPPDMKPILERSMRALGVIK